LARPASSVVARRHVLFGNRANTSTSINGVPRECTVTPDRAGVSSRRAAGMLRNRLDPPTSVYRGDTPATLRVPLLMIETPSPRRSIRYRRWSDPGTSPTGMRPNTDAMTSFRVDWPAAMPSMVMLFGRAPGESISKRSLNMASRIRCEAME